MYRFWEVIIRPSLELLNAKSVVEIGIDEGKNTAKILEYCKKNHARFYGIDPSPRIDVQETFKEYNDCLTYYPLLSLNAIEKLPPFDVILIDGDHNWYTVYNELKLIRKTNKKFPVVFFHDISWPYARRDLYYNPDNIPKAYLNAYAQKGIDIDGTELIEKGGMNASFNNCIYENSINNGVLTAIEDFISEQKDGLEFIKIFIFNGLGVLYDAQYVTQEFIDFITKFKLDDDFNSFLVSVDKAIAREHVSLLESKHANNALRKNVESLTEENDHYKVRYKELEEQNQELEEQNQELEEQNQELEEQNQELEEQNQKLNERCILFNEIQKNNSILEDKVKNFAEKYAMLECQYNDVVKKYQKSKQDFIEYKERVKNIIGSQLNNIYNSKKTIGYKYALKKIRNHSIKNIISNIKTIKLMRKNNDFDYSYYLEKNSDICSSGIDPLIHCIWFGGYEGRKCAPDFDAKYYMQRNADVQESKMNPFVHYYLYGKSENRSGIASKIELSGQQETSLYTPVISSNIKGPKVSIIMPTWNRSAVICNAIDSILRQSYQNFELVISDDGSDDGTENLIKDKYCKEIELGKIVYIKSKVRQGVCKARNLALQRSTGEYIAYLDSDNVWRLDFLSEMMGVFLKNAEYSCVYCDEEVKDNVRGKKMVRSVDYDRKKLLTQNFIDLNVFMHKRILYIQNGGFDENLKRLVDWDLIVRYTRYNKPYHLKKTLVDYFVDKKLNNISNTVSLDDNYNKIAKKHRRERAKYGIDILNIAYVLWDYPAASQTFVFNEIKYAIEQGYHVTVFYKELAVKSRQPNFEIEAYKVNDHNHLAKLLIEHDIDIIHTHFVYPAGTLLTYEASKITGIPFTIAAHAVDIFHHSNVKRNRIKEIAEFENCEKILVSGGFSFDYLRDKGVPGNKIIFSNQTVDERFVNYEIKGKKFNQSKIHIAAIGRYIEKKGFEYLIEAARYLDDSIEINIYGYGDLEGKYKELINKLNVSNRVKIRGEIASPEELKQVYEESDLLVVPSVVAENGDMDGVPTVVLEAMGMGVPVIGTSVSSIPYTIKNGYNGFVVEPNSSEALAEKIKYVVGLDRNDLKRIIENAKATIQELATQMTMQHTLVSLWKQEEVDVFLVIYNKGEDIDETKQIINNIYDKTSSRFILTVVDNNSSKQMKDYLYDLAGRNSNIRYINLEQNIMCGPASNLALSQLENEYAIYICSNEGYVLKYGWERELVSYMKKNSNCALAGHLSYSPKFYNKKTYAENSWFKDFRNAYKLNSLPEDIYHIQGGIYVLRMEVFTKHGGFSDKFPQDLMDVEYSYYLQTCGYDLGNIPTIICGTKKTLPVPEHFIDEQTLVIHPFNKEGYKRYLAENEKNKCSICNTYEHFTDGKCPKCGSSSKDRALYRYLYDSNLIYRGVELNCEGYMTLCDQLRNSFKKMFNVTHNDVLEEGIVLCNTIDSNKEVIKNCEKIIFVGNASEIAEFDKLLTSLDLELEKEAYEYYSKQAEIIDVQIVQYNLNKKRK